MGGVEEVPCLLVERRSLGELVDTAVPVQGARLGVVIVLYCYQGTWTVNKVT